MEISFENIIGKTILVGITYVSNDELVLEQIQFFGTVEHADEEDVISIMKAKGDEVFNLPPDLSSFSIAQPGEYTLKSTGEVIVNPDLLTTWTVYMAPE